MARIKFKKKYPNLTEGIDEKLLDESMKDWVADKFGLQRKPSKKELEEKAKQQAELIRMLKLNGAKKDVIQQAMNKFNMLVAIAGSLYGSAWSLYRIGSGISGIYGNFKQGQAQKAAIAKNQQINDGISKNPVKFMNMLAKSKTQEEAEALISNLNSDNLKQLSTLFDTAIARNQDKPWAQVLQRTADLSGAPERIKKNLNSFISPNDTQPSLWNSTKKLFTTNPMDTWNNMGTYGKVGVGVAGAVALGAGLYAVGNKIYKKIKDRRTNKTKLIKL